MLLVGQPILGNPEIAALTAVVRAGWITMGEQVGAFERAFAERHRMADAVAVNSCTAGLHLALAALGIGTGDEVLVPSMSFVATANCALYVGATPVFVDVEGLKRPLLSLADAERKCTPRTKAVIVMHYAGYLVDGDAWRRFADRRGIFLIEDAAHAAGAESAGSFGDMAVFSFYGNKNMTTAEGGMVVGRHSDALPRVRLMRAHGMTSSAHQRFNERAATYDVTTLGWNYRMDELRAAIGLVQLLSLTGWNARRAHLARVYQDALTEHCPDVFVAFDGDRGPSAHHILPVILPRGSDRDAVRDRMQQAGVQTTVHYPPIHQMTFYRTQFPSAALPVTEEFARRELTLPLHPLLEDADVEKVAIALSSALAR